MSNGGNPITVLVSLEKLNGDNFIRWKSNLNLMLICENHKFFLTKECLVEPTTTSLRDKYDAWIQSNNKAKCYMLVSMNDVLRTKHEPMESTFEIRQSLQAMFGQQSDQSRHEATRTYMTTKMKKGVSMREHVLSMINVMHEAEIHGAIIDEHTQVSIILESLTLSFSAFTTNYIMNKLEFNMTQLLNELQTFESLNKCIIKETKENVVEEKPSNSEEKSKRRKKNNDKDKVKGKKSKKSKKAPKAKENKNDNNSKKKEPKGKFFHCAVEGHWKRNYKKYLFELKKKGKYDLLVLEACVVEDDMSS